jgi:hypothetical protein
MTLLYVESMALGGGLSLLIAHWGKAEPSEEFLVRNVHPRGYSAAKVCR